MNGEVGAHPSPQATQSDCAKANMHTLKKPGTHPIGQDIYAQARGTKITDAGVINMLIATKCGDVHVAAWVQHHMPRTSTMACHLVMRDAGCRIHPTKHSTKAPPR